MTCPLETLPCAAARADRALHITAANGRFVESWLAVRSVTRSLEPVACEAAVDIVVDVEDAPLIVIGDMQDLTRIVGNPVANAIKFSHRGGKVECQLSRDRGWARLVVRDSGRGIDASFLPQVFDCFRQEPRTGAERTDGAGPGLAVVRQLVQEHGGIVRGGERGTWPRRNVHRAASGRISVGGRRARAGQPCGKSLVWVTQSLSTMDHWHP